MIYVVSKVKWAPLIYSSTSESAADLIFLRFYTRLILFLSDCIFLGLGNDRCVNCQIL